MQGLDINKLKDKKSKIVSTKKSLKDVEPLIINKFADLKFKVYIYNLDMTVDVQRINFDTKTIEVLIGEDDFLHNDLYEYSFDEVDLIQEN